MNNDIFEPLVTVVITTKNRKEPLIRAVESVKNQSYKNIEIIIVDDGSDNDIYQRTLSFDYKCEVSILRNEESKGACHARNIGIRNARGSLIAGLDDDDEFEVHRLKNLVTKYKSSGNRYSLFCSHSKIIKHNGEICSEKKKSNFITKHMMYKTNCVGSQVLVKKQNLVDAGLFDEHLVASQDHDMWLRVIERFGDAYKFTDELYICYDAQDQNRVSNRKLKGLIQFYRKHSNKMTYLEKTFNFLRAVKMILDNPSHLRHLKDL